MGLGAAELLEEVLQIVEQSVFPTWRISADRFVDIINKETTELMFKLRQDFDNIERLISKCKEETTVLDILKNLRQLFVAKLTIVYPSELFQQFYKTGFTGILTDKELNFLSDETLSTHQREDRFHQYIENFTKSSVWRIRDFPISCRKDDGVNKVDGRPENYPQCFDSKPEFFAFFTAYLGGKRSEEDLLKFMQANRCEKEDIHFEDCLTPWLEEMQNKLHFIEIRNEFEFAVRPFQLQKALIGKEINRMSKFLYAATLNKPEMIEEHKRFVMEMMRDAAAVKQMPGQAPILPLISFGQLPLPGGNKQRVVECNFVLANNILDQEIKTIVNELKKTLSKKINEPQKREIEGVRVIHLDMETDDNVPEILTPFFCKLADLQIRAVLVGEFGFKGFRHAMIPSYNRIYSVNFVDRAEGFIPTYFKEPFNRGGEPYFCPNGWRRYAIDVGLTGAEFEKQYKDWHVAYHGTNHDLAMPILLNGLRASGQGCFLKGGEGAVYLSPSIEYSGHHKYAEIWKFKEKYIQMVLQVRVNKNLVFEKRPGTLFGAAPADPPMDPNFVDNNQLEWVVKWTPKSSITVENGILIYGIMLRVSSENPKNLPQNRWWVSAPPELS